MDFVSKSGAEDAGILPVRPEASHNGSYKMPCCFSVLRVLQSDPEVFAGPLGTLVERLPETHIEARC